jgi:hypothetical protein
MAESDHDDDPLIRQSISMPKSLLEMAREYQREEKIARLSEAWRRLVIEGYRAWKRKKL